MTNEAFNTAIRRAAGRPRPLERQTPDAPGDLGVGRGGAAAPQPRAATNEPINNVIRLGARAARMFTLPNGVDLGTIDSDDLYRR